MPSTTDAEPVLAIVFTRTDVGRRNCDADGEESPAVLMEYDYAHAIVNRDEPIPVIRIPFQDSNDGTSTPSSSVAGDMFQEQVGGLNDRLKESGSTGGFSLQDRVFAGVMAQIIPRADINAQDIDPKAERRSSKYVDKPGFSLSTMSVNFRRFNARVGVLFVFQSRMIRLFEWRRPSQTLSFLVVYTLVCLNPNLLPVIPLAMALYSLMMPAFLARHPTPPTDPIFETRNFGPATAPASRVKPAPEMSKDFFRNMRDLQNSMEDFSRVHDLVNDRVAPHINFSNETVSSGIFIGTFALAVSTFLAGSLIPWQAILVVTGWAAIGSSHPSVQEFLTSPEKSKSAQRQAESTSTWLGRAIGQDIVLDEAPEVRQVEIFELQRFQTPSETWESWLFSPAPYDPISPARIAGARPKGTQFFEDVQAPAGWTWKERKWMLDLQSRDWIEQRMITGVEVETQGERWVYDIPAEEEEDLSATVTGSSSKGKKKAKILPKSGWEEGSGIEKRGEWRRRRWTREVQRKVV